MGGVSTIGGKLETALISISGQPPIGDCILSTLALVTSFSTLICSRPFSWIMPRILHSLLLSLVLAVFLLFPRQTSAGATNTTFDDTDSSFSWWGTWTSITPASPCSGCASQPDTSRTRGGTWHDGNFPAGNTNPTGGSFTFTGSSVYIYGIDQWNIQADIVFTLPLASGNVVSTHHYSGNENYVYSVPFFSASGFPEKTYAVTWVLDTHQSTGVHVQVALIDYAIVTAGVNSEAAPPPTTGGSPSTGTSQEQTGTKPQPSGTDSQPEADSTRRASSTPISSSHSPSGQPSSISRSKISSPSISSPVSENNPSQTSSELAGHDHRRGLAKILGPLFAAVAVLVLLLFLWYRRRNRQTRGRMGAVDQPFHRMLQGSDINLVSSGFVDPRNAIDNLIPLFPQSQGKSENDAAAVSTTREGVQALDIPGISHETRMVSPSQTDSVDVRLLAERIAELEARVNGQTLLPDPELEHPPPYFGSAMRASDLG
ncbi:hypothetical protein MIND_00935800 [Mycena indigotica]|uniref:Uncharacterized protein n=1 Tax=Mycena indigotica TaxID=2126181 RepID=A0A8H6W0F5_9AGAR|nr:uncharacterized protein MIND_00935800 [Mycena indigotica]KAF7297033.1 hypothetical protein MIND_00935800 [Mycena indigotica]